LFLSAAGITVIQDLIQTQVENGLKDLERGFDDFRAMLGFISFSLFRYKALTLVGRFYIIWDQMSWLGEG
jgi:hypothetical protein